MNCVSTQFLIIGALYEVARLIDNGEIPMIVFIDWDNKIFLGEDIRLCPSTNLSIVIL